MSNYQAAGEDYSPDCPFHDGDRVRLIHANPNPNLAYPREGAIGTVIRPNVSGVIRSSHGDHPFYVWVEWDSEVPSLLSVNMVLSDELEKEEVGG